MKSKKLLFTISIILLLSSCKPVKEYQKMYLNDSEMELSMRKIDLVHLQPSLLICCTITFL